MPFFDLTQAERIFYLDENPSGSPVLFLLHGLGINSNSWQLQLPIFARAGYRVVAPDIPGFGQSSNARFTDFQQLASNMADLIISLKLATVITIGISMGGILALQLILDHPNLVECQVLVNTMAKFDLGNPLLWPYYLSRVILIQTKGLEEQAKVVAGRIFPRLEDRSYRQFTIDMIMEADPDSYRTAMRAIARFNVFRRLHEIECSTLVITGANDNTIPAKNQLTLVRGISNAVHVVIPDAGHAVCIDQPAIFNCTVLEFLNGRHPHNSLILQEPL